MPTRVLVALLLGSAALSANAQRHQDAVPSDTVRPERIVLLDPGLSLGRATFLFPAATGSVLPFHDFALSVPQLDPGRAGPFVGSYLEPRADLMSPLRLQMQKEKLSSFQTALGAVQLGAVGYLAYRHIKKYGLFR